MWILKEEPIDRGAKREDSEYERRAEQVLQNLAIGQLADSKIIGINVQDFLTIPWYRNEFTGELERYPIKGTSSGILPTLGCARPLFFHLRHHIVASGTGGDVYTMVQLAMFSCWIGWCAG